MSTVIRTFCWHDWEKWSDPFQGSWTHRDQWGEEDVTETTVKYMTQRRMCKKCGKVRYRKCT